MLTFQYLQYACITVYCCSVFCMLASQNECPMYTDNKVIVMYPCTFTQILLKRQVSGTVRENIACISAVDVTKLFINYNYM